MSETAVIETRSLTKRYGAHVGVDSLDLSVGQGEVFGFLGPNGAGKSTAIRVLLGLLQATSGDSTVFGLNCWTESHRIKSRVGYVPGDVRLYGRRHGACLLRQFEAIRRQPMVRAGNDLAERFELDLQVPVQNMSRGMRQKLALILALAPDPDVLILDEPTTALDPLMRNLLLDLLEVRAASGRTVFFSSHTLSEVQRLCDRVAILREGRLVAAESIDALRRRALRRLVVEWADASNTPDVPGELLDRVAVNGKRWEADVTGEIPALLDWLSGQAVLDFSLSPPDLDRVFRRYYQEPSDE